MKRKEAPQMRDAKDYKASFVGDDKANDGAKFGVKKETIEMLGNVSATSIPYLPTELHFYCDSDNLIEAALASSSPMFGGSGFIWVASPHAIRAALPYPATAHRAAVRLCSWYGSVTPPFLTRQDRLYRGLQKLKYSISHSSVKDSMQPPKEELAEWSVVQNRKYSNVEGYGVGDIVWGDDDCQSRIQNAQYPPQKGHVVEDTLNNKTTKTAEDCDPYKYVAAGGNLEIETLKVFQEPEPHKNVVDEDNPVNKTTEMVQSGAIKETLEMDPHASTSLRGPFV